MNGMGWDVKKNGRLGLGYHDSGYTSSLVSKEKKRYSVILSQNEQLNR
jgi:hypothetical protein